MTRASSSTLSARCVNIRPAASVNPRSSRGPAQGRQRTRSSPPTGNELFTWALPAILHDDGASIESLVRLRIASHRLRPQHDSRMQQEPGVALHLVHLMHTHTLLHDESALDCVPRGQLMLLLHHLAFKICSLFYGYPCVHLRQLRRTTGQRVVYGKLGSQDSQIVRNDTGQDRSCASEHMFPGLVTVVSQSSDVCPLLPDCPGAGCKAFHHTGHHTKMIDHHLSPKERHPAMIGRSASFERQA